MQKADLAFEGFIADGVFVQAAREATKDGMWHFRFLNKDAEAETTWIRQPEYLDDMITEEGQLVWGKYFLVPMKADKIRLPE